MSMYEPRKKKPPVAVVFGILHLVFGTLSLLCNLCAVSGIAVIYFGFNTIYSSAPPEDKRELDKLWQSLQDNVPGLVVFMFADVILSMLMGLVLMVAGIGLLGVKTWARYLSVAWAVVRLVLLLLSLFYTLVFVNPGMEKFGKDMQQWSDKMEKKTRPPGSPPPPKTQFQSGTGNPVADMATSIFSTAIQSIYAIVVMIFMLLPRTAYVFRVYQGLEEDYSSPQNQQDFYDDEYERRRREMPPPDDVPPP